jgi:hypothetical protein
MALLPGKPEIVLPRRKKIIFVWSDKRGKNKTEG